MKFLGNICSCVYLYINMKQTFLGIVIEKNNELTIYENFISYYIIYHSIIYNFKEQFIEINCFHLNKLEAHIVICIK